MTAQAFIDESVALLERTPKVVSALLHGLPEEWLGVPDVEGGWTAHNVVGHLISAELADWIPRAERILSDGTTRPFDPFDRFEMLERDRGVALDALIDRFADLRAHSIGRLRALVKSDADLERRGLHQALGEVTLRELIATWAVHDVDHVAQIYSSLAASHDADVGPWKAYLGILLRRDDPAAKAG